jgi:hypothetical protein
VRVLLEAISDCCAVRQLGGFWERKVSPEFTFSQFVKNPS